MRWHIIISLWHPGSGQEFRGLRPTEWKERKGKILEFVNEESPDPMAE